MKISKSLKNIAKISGGAIVGQIIATVTLPFITRIYGAEIIGIWTVITSFSNIITNICDMGLSNSLMMCKEEVMQEWYSIVVKLSAIISFICGIFIFLYHIIATTNMNYSVTVALFSVLYAFLFRWVNICLIVLNRNKEYTTMMVNAVLRFSVIAIVAISLGILGLKSYGYYIGNILGQAITVIHMKHCLPRLKIRNNATEYFEVIRQNKKYIKYQMPASIALTLRTELPNLLISSLFGNTLLGYFSISQKLLTIPVTFLGQSLGKIFYQKTAEMRRRDENISRFVEKTVNRGMVIAIIPMTLFAAFGDALVVMYFGTEYAVAGVICRIIVYRSLFNFISSTTQGLDIVIDKQQYVLFTCLTQTMLASLSVLCGYYIFDSIYVASILLALTFIVIQVLYFCSVYRVMKLDPCRYLRNVVLMLLFMFISSSLLRNATLYLLDCFSGSLFAKILSCFVR